MGIVVQKYGGSSLSDASAIKRVARRIVEQKKAGNDVVVAVSAMGDTTDELLDLAGGVSPVPPARELDMLLTAGERISMALVAMVTSTATPNEPPISWPVVFRPESMPASASAAPVSTDSATRV